MFQYSTRALTSTCIILLFCSCSSRTISSNQDWKLVWQDEFEDEKLDRSNWTFDLGTGAPSFKEYGYSSPYFVPENFATDNFSVRWEGEIKIDYNSDYTFYIISDDGVKLFINNKILIDNWEPQPATEKKGVINLQKDKKHTIRIEYFEQTGGEAMVLGWECEKFSKRLVPSSHLSTPNGKPGLRGTYFKNKELEQSATDSPFVRIDKEINWVTGGGWGNNESQYYTDRPKNVRIEDGKLIIESHKESYRGSNYTSSRIKTKSSWKYGRFQIRAKLPSGRGTWSALWALPTDWEYGNWPLSGEIDIMEHVGYDEDIIVTSLHNAALSAGKIGGTDQHGYIEQPDACREFNTYTLEWSENEIKIFVNDKISLQYPRQDKNWAKWPFDKRFHLLFNIAVGGNWGGAKGIDDSVFPSRMEIDYVRVYSNVGKRES